LHTYRVSFNMNNDDLSHFLLKVAPHLGRVTVTWVNEIPDRQQTAAPVPEAPEQPQEAPPEPEKAPRAPRAKRPSKINAVILKALADGPRRVPELKEALVIAGFSAASLSTGIASLQTSDQICRIDDGKYAIQDTLPLEQPAAAE